MDLNELDKTFGPHKRFETSLCFRKNDHYYCQMNDFIIHVKERFVINKLHNSTFDNMKGMRRITFDKFKTVLLNTIFELDIYEFTKNKKDDSN